MVQELAHDAIMRPERAADEPAVATAYLPINIVGERTQLVVRTVP